MTARANLRDGLALLILHNEIIVKPEDVIDLFFSTLQTVLNVTVHRKTHFFHVRTNIISLKFTAITCFFFFFFSYGFYTIMKNFGLFSEKKIQISDPIDWHYIKLVALALRT